MTSRERIKLALNHKEADRVPIDIGSMRSTGISALAYGNLLKHLEFNEGPVKMYDFQQQLAYTGELVRKRFHVDSIDAGQAFLKKREEWTSFPLSEQFECVVPGYLRLERDSIGTVYMLNDQGIRVGHKPPSSLYLDQCFWPWKDLDSIPNTIESKSLNSHMWAIPCPPMHLDITQNDHDYNYFIEQLKQLHEKSDYAIMLSIGHSFFEQGTFIRGMDNYLMDIYLDNKGVMRLNQKLEEEYLPRLEKIITGVKDYVDIIQFGDDLGTQDSPWMSDDIFASTFLPRYKKLWDYVHNNSDCKIFMHSCGAIFNLLPFLIDAGLDIINPVQTSAKGMDPLKLKEKYGKDLTFWGGGADTQSILSKGTVGEIRDDVKRRLDTLSKDGGFVFNQIHNILADVPPENIVAMYDAAYEFGNY